MADVQRNLDNDDPSDNFQDKSTQRMQSRATKTAGTKPGGNRKALIGCALVFVVIAVVAVGAIVFFADDDGEGDRTQTVDKLGSIEVVYTSKHLDAQTDILAAHYRVYKNNATVMEYDVIDTVPGLGSAPKPVKKEDGKEVTENVPNEYDIFVTVK